MSRAATPADVIAGAARYAVAHGDWRAAHAQIPDGIAQTCVTSPPYYGLRDYGCDGQIGLEQTPAEYVAQIVAVMREVRRVLRDDGTAWLNLGDSYASDVKGSGGKGKSRLGPNRDLQNMDHQRFDPRKFNHDAKPKDLLGIPWRVAFALQDDGWWLRCDIVWSKPNPMPESVTDRPTRAHEYVFLLTKSARYFYDADAVREPHGSSFSADAIRLAGGAIGGARPEGNNFSKEARHRGGDSSPRTRAERAALLNPNGRNARSVWTITPEPYAGAHFATMPPELARRCILAGSRRGDVVLDPFAGAGTTALVAVGHGRRAIGCELNPEYAALAVDRVAAVDTDATQPVRVEAPQWGALFGEAS
mgnify:CR=1 FL=1